MNAHVEWLREMREKFLRERDLLKEAARPYRGGEFIWRGRISNSGGGWGKGSRPGKNGERTIFWP